MEKGLITVVLCDDETAILQELREAPDWQKLGCAVVGTASSGSTALELILLKRPDLAIVDINMPEISGLEMIRRARTASIPTDFLILSGYDDFHYAQDAIQNGVKSYLLKPLQISKLETELLRIIQERLHEQKDGMNRLRQQRLNDSFFQSLLDGKILEPALVKLTLQKSELSLTEESACVEVLSFPENVLTESTRLRLLHCLETELQDVPHYFLSYGSRQLVGIFNQSARSPFELAGEILTTLREQGLNDVLIGIGDNVASLINLPYSYRRALTALSYRLYAPKLQIFSYEMICSVPPKTSLSDIDYLPLVQYIVKRDIPHIRSYCESFMKQLLYVPMPTPNYVYSSCYALYSMIQQEFRSYSHEELKLHSDSTELYRFQTLSEIQGWLIKAFTQLSEFIDAVYGYGSHGAESSSDKEAESVPTEADAVITSAKQYIHEHIRDNLRMEDIARHVNLSVSYFAIYFKNKTMTNLRDYLLREKMEYARKALLSPENTVSSIAYELGYQDYRSFSRAFKNIHGITPSDFQQKYHR